jgi:hypothetical protein
MKKLTMLALFAAACGGAPGTVGDEPAAESQNATKSDSYGYCHIGLQDSTNTVQAVFDYKLDSTMGQQITNTGKSVWLNAKGIDSNAKVQAAVVVIGYVDRCPKASCDASQYSAKTYDMHYENGRFTAAIDDLPISHYDEGDDIAGLYEWQLAIVADNVWYKNGNSNMQSFPAEISGFCGDDKTF